MPSRRAVPSAAPPASQAEASSVPATTASCIGHSRRSSAPSCPPLTSCSTLVTSEGSSSKAAAQAGDISAPSTPMATVGRPMPVTPFTQPATKNVPSTISHHTSVEICMPP